MEIGNAAQWGAVATALILGARAEVRAFRDRRRERATNEAVAFASLTAILAQASAALPDDHSKVTPSSKREELRQLSDDCRDKVNDVAAAFPESAGTLLTLADQLDDFIRLSETIGDPGSAEILKGLHGLNHTLVLLSVTTATRVRLQKELVSMETFDGDRYYKEFKNRYERVRRQQWQRLGFK
jgi:hypothetical protein